MIREKMNEYQRKYYECNKEKRLARQKRYYENNKEKIWAGQKRYYERNKVRVIASHRDITLKRKYGITAAEFDVIAESQRGVCKLCGGKNNDRRLHVDHCHETGRIRGLLCRICNQAVIGNIEARGINPEEIVNYMRAE